jgi:hypothetical protein
MPCDDAWTDNHRVIFTHAEGFSTQSPVYARVRRGCTPRAIPPDRMSIVFKDDGARSRPR